MNTDDSSIGRIIGSEKLISIFGRWPSFHDAEVLSLIFSRDSPDSATENAGTARHYGPTLTAEIHVFEMTNEVSSTGHYVFRNHCIAALRFYCLDQVELFGFNQQNALEGLSIQCPEANKDRFEITFESGHGVGLDLVCFAVEVTAVTRGIPPNSVYKS